MDNVSGNQKLKTHLEKVYKRELTEKEVADDKDRLVKFFLLLIEIDQRNKRLKKN